MKLIFLSCFLAPLFVPAQNVGIGTSSPQQRLQINSGSSSTKSHLLLVDSTFSRSGKIGFRNLSNTNGIDLHGFTEGSLYRQQYLDVQTDSAFIATFRGNGFVGIRNGIPNYPLDVSGDINTSGSIRVNGTDGLPGQALMKNSSGALSWQYPEEFRNVASFATPGSTTWTVPAGVTRIKVELWGGGASGGAAYSGGAGAYITAVLNVTAAQVWSITVANGGLRVASGDNGESSVFTRAASGITLTAGGGNRLGGYSVFSAAGTSSFMGLQGAGGRSGDRSNLRSGTTDYIYHANADGASAPLMPHTGGKSGSASFVASTYASAGNSPGGDGAQPGGGGGLGVTNGGDGMVVVYW